MSKFKKLLSVTLALVMAVGIIIPVSAFTVAPDVAGTKFEDAAATLGALGIMIGDDKGNFRPDDAISRAEFAKIAVHALGLEGVAETAKGTSIFPDVALDHWANGYINVASSQKIIIGDENGRFNPEATISYQDAVTILVRVLGQEPAALSKGAYPTGYLVQGEESGITKKVTGLATTSASRGTVALMTFNSLTINLMEQVGFGKDATYEIVDKTLLENKLNVEKHAGVVTGNALTRLDGTSSLKDDEVEIGAGNIYKVGDSKANELLGYQVVYYVKENDNKDKVVVLAQPEANKNSTITIEAKDLASEIQSNSTAISYYPDEDSKAEDLQLASNVKVIYNQKASELRNPTTGTITLLDTTRDDKYDVVFINEHVNYVVDDVSTISNRVYDKYDQETLVLDTKANKDLKVIIEDTDGKAMSISDLTEWDVLSVYKNTNYVKIIVSREFVEGMITETSDELDKVGINGTEYEIAKNVDAADLTLELEGKFYLDMEGKIAGFNAESRKATNYAYMLNAAVSEDFDAVLNVKLFTAAGETKILTATDKLKIDNQSGYNSAAALAELKGENSSIAPTLITYELNSSGKIVSIDRAEDKTANFPQSFAKSMFALNFDGQDLIYKATSKKLAIVDENGITTGSIGVNADTIIFDIPAGETDPDNMAIRNISMLNDKSSYDVKVFDLGADMTAKVLLVTSSVNANNIEAPIAIVDRITRINNADGVGVDKLYAMVNGQMISVTTESIETLTKADGSKVVAGDVIQYNTNTKGELDKFTLLLDINAKSDEFKKAYGTDNEMVTVYGKVTKKFAGSINVTVGDGTAINYSTENAKVYSFDSTKTTSKLSVVTAGEITKWETGANEVRVFVRIYKDQVQEIVIVK